MVTLRINETLPVWEVVPWYVKPLIFLGICARNRIWFAGITSQGTEFVTVHPENLETLILFLKMRDIPYQMEKPTLRAINDTLKK